MRCALCLSVTIYVSLKDNYSPALLQSPRPRFDGHEMVLRMDLDPSPAASVGSKRCCSHTRVFVSLNENLVPFCQERVLSFKRM